MIKDILNKASIKESLTDEIKAICLYRYFSLALTSIFYLVGNLHSSLWNKIIVIICLTVASLILNYLYIKNQEDKRVIKILVFIEIVGNILVLIPTDGLNSPYMWYSLNTILVTMIFLNIYYCCFNLLIYLALSIGISFLTFDKQSNDLIKILSQNSNFILSFILITAAAQGLLALNKKLRQEGKKLINVNSQLAVSNERIKEYMEQVMSLYKVVHSFTNQNNQEKLVKIITNYTKEITRTELAFSFIMLSKQKYKLETSSGICKDSEDELVENIKKQWRNIKETDMPINISSDNRNFIVVIVKASHKEYGVLGIEIDDSKTKELLMENIGQLKFLAELSAIVLERLELEGINENLSVAEEQNRIANEIHDSVSQRLFISSCAIHSLIKKINKVSNEDLVYELGTIKEALKQSMKELRETIYGLSWEKNGLNKFRVYVKNYINDESMLSGVHISFHVIGNDELLCINLKKAIYRIICEGTGNAIRHGKCSCIDIILDVKKDYTKLSIQDDGNGFDLNKIDHKDMGLGIKNMFNLVNCFNGEMSIDSECEKGTTINIVFEKDIYKYNRQEETV